MIPRQRRLSAEQREKNEKQIKSKALRVSSLPHACVQMAGASDLCMCKQVANDFCERVIGFTATEKKMV